MTRRDITIVLGTLVVAVGLSAILFIGAAATAPRQEGNASKGVNQHGS